MRILLLFIAFIALPACAQTEPERPHVVVTGFGKVEAVPDQVRVNFTISELAASVAQARQPVERITGQIIKEAQKLGLKDKDITASQIRVNPEYEWNKGKRFLKGQRVERQVTLRIKDTERYGEVIDAAVKAGVTEVGQVSLEVADRTALERKALQLALDDAKAKATLMAKQLGAKVGDVFRIDENSSRPQPGPQPRPQFRAMAMADSAEESAPMMLGSQDISATVAVVFYLK